MSLDYISGLHFAMSSLNSLSFLAANSLKSRVLKSKTWGISNRILAPKKIPTTCDASRTIATTSVCTREYIGQSGRKYNVSRVLRENKPLQRVYIACAENRNFMLNYIHSVNFDNLQAINDKLRGRASYIRLAEDIIPETSMFVFEYFTDHLLHLAQMSLPLQLRKRVLKDALRGLAELHDQDIVQLICESRGANLLGHQYCG